MNIALWIVQGIVAIMFIMAGVMKSTQPKEKLLPKTPWIKDFYMGLVKTIGIFELLGGIGIILPMLLGITPILTVIAALGLCGIMICAMIYHLGKKEYKEIMFNLVLFLLAAFVAFGRFY